MKRENILIDDGTSIYELDGECMNRKKRENAYGNLEWQKEQSGEDSSSDLNETKKKGRN